MGALHLLAVLLLGALGLSLAAEESCEGYCFHGFNANRKCQCDYMCPYYESCCSDYETVCKLIEKRGDVFVVPEDGDYEENINDFNYTTNAFLENLSVDEVPSPASSTLATTTLNEKITETITDRIAEVPDVPDVPDIPDELCSGKPFDAFTNVKNGSIYAFRGKYFYELNDSKALEGYPKRIKDVWGIEGPIDAAFTRINCQGKTYIFKGKNYWRFTDGVLDPKYPLEISDGFSNIPDDVDAAFALPANNYNDKEKVYFFKGSKYWQYEFKNQPSWEECLESTPSEIFTRYLRVQDDSLESFFELLFGSWEKKKTRPSYIRSDWRGVPINVDAVLPSRIYFPVQTRSSTRRNKRRKSRRRKNRKRRPSKKSSWYDDLFSLFDADDDDDDVESDPDWLPPVSQPRCQPIQSVYFFKNDKYYRVNLQRKSVDMVYPRYPRSIGKYWLGCESD